MKVLNARQIEFINLLLGEKTYKPIKWYSENLSVSDKTLKKDLIIIEDYLHKFNVDIHRKHGFGLMIKDVWNAKLLIQDNLHIQEDKRISINDRRIDIIKTILMDSQNKTSIQKLSDKYYVSKTSIINDFKYIESWLSSFDLVFKKTVEGTKIIGDEINIRKAIASLLFEYSNGGRNDRSIEELVMRLDARTLEGLSELFEKDKIIYVNNLLLDLERKYDCRIYDPYYINLLTHILISMVRSNTGKLKFSSEKIENLKFKINYKEAILCIDKINKDFNMNLGESEVYYLYQYFVSFGLIKKEVNDDDILDKLTATSIIFRDTMTEYLEEILQVNIKKDKEAMEKLLLHIRAMLSRIEYDIKISNSLINDIEKQYPFLLNLCKLVALMASYRLNQKEIPIDEIGYLTLYYQLGLEGYHIKKRVLVVCHSGYGTSTLLSTKLKRYFPGFEIIENISSNNIISRNLKDIDFIVSTVPLDIKEKPHLLVSAFLGENDIKNITDFLTNIKDDKCRTFISTNYIGKHICEEFIYFNTSRNIIIEDLRKNIKSQIKFNEININKNLNINIGFYKEDKLGVCINDIEGGEKEINFYIIVNDFKGAIEILKEVVNFKINDDYGVYLRKCKKKKDVKQYFNLNSKGDSVMEIDLSKVICKERIKLNMKARNKKEALEELTDLLYDTDVISDKKAFLDDVYYRETLGSTGIGNGISIPHGKSKFVKKTSIVFGKTSADLEWETLDDKPVKFIILFAVTESDKTSTHVRLLSKVATKLGDDEACKALLEAKTPEEVYDIFTKSEENI